MLLGSYPENNAHIIAQQSNAPVYLWIGNIQCNGNRMQKLKCQDCECIQLILPHVSILVGVNGPII